MNSLPGRTLATASHAGGTLSIKAAARLPATLPTQAGRSCCSSACARAAAFQRHHRHRAGRGAGPQRRLHQADPRARAPQPHQTQCCSSAAAPGRCHCRCCCRHRHCCCTCRRRRRAAALRACCSSPPPAPPPAAAPPRRRCCRSRCWPCGCARSAMQAPHRQSLRQPAARQRRTASRLPSLPPPAAARRCRCRRRHQSRSNCSWGSTTLQTLHRPRSRPETARSSAWATAPTHCQAAAAARLRSAQHAAAA